MKVKYGFPARAKAEEAGFRVDTYSYPWVAYKGPRFQAIEACFVPTDREATLMEFARGTIRYGGNTGDDFLANHARAVLEEVES